MARHGVVRVPSVATYDLLGAQGTLIQRERLKALPSLRIHMPSYGHPPHSQFWGVSGVVDSLLGAGWHRVWR